jgi:hypothetical protein
MITVRVVCDYKLAKKIAESLSFEKRIDTRISTGFVERIVGGTRNCSSLLGLDDGVGTSTRSGGSCANGCNNNTDKCRRTDTGANGKYREFRCAWNNSNSAFSSGSVTKRNLARNICVTLSRNKTTSINRIAHIVGTKIVISAGNVGVHASEGVVTLFSGTIVVVIAIEIVRLMETTSYRMTVGVKT